jgi:DNA ligase-1
MNNKLKPMRGVAPKKALADFPYYASPKIDGMRAMVVDGVVLSKSMKPIPNEHVQTLFGHLHGADGELTVGPMNSQFEGDDVFARSRGPIMSRIQRADFQFWIFDGWAVPTMPLYARLGWLEEGCDELNHPQVNLVEHTRVTSQEELAAIHAAHLAGGFEGTMLRRIAAPYKYGQSTEREGYLLKLKPFQDSEAVVLDCVEQMENTNPGLLNELGYTQRSSAKAGKRGKDTFGAFKVRDLYSGVEFEVGNGPGLTDARRAVLWAFRHQLPGRVITYTYQAIGSQDKPRLPQFKAFRDPIDLSDWEMV